MGEELGSEDSVMPGNKRKDCRMTEPDNTNRRPTPDTQERSKRKMFHEDEERHEIKPSEAKTTRRAGREDSR